MQAYIAKRMLLFIPTLILVTVIIFTILRVIPGDPALLLLSPGDVDSQENFTQLQLEKLRAKLGTDRPIYVQHGDWVWKMLQFDFGTSHLLEHLGADTKMGGKFPEGWGEGQACRRLCRRGDPGDLRSIEGAGPGQAQGFNATGRADTPS